MERIERIERIKLKVSKTQNKKEKLKSPNNKHHVF